MIFIIFLLWCWSRVFKIEIRFYLENMKLAVIITILIPNYCFEFVVIYIGFILCELWGEWGLVIHVMFIRVVVKWFRRLNLFLFMGLGVFNTIGSSHSHLPVPVFVQLCILISSLDAANSNLNNAFIVGSYCLHHSCWKLEPFIFLYK